MRRRESSDDLDLPLTPLIDCTFLLIIFFLLTAQLAGRELPDLLLSEPQETTSSELPSDVENRNHVTVNVLNQYGEETEDRSPQLSRMASRYQVGVENVKVGRSGAINHLKGVLQSRRAQAAEQDVSDYWVEIRADRDIRYGDVRPVMEAAADAGIARMSLTTQGEKEDAELKAEGR